MKRIVSVLLVISLFFCVITVPSVSATTGNMDIYALYLDVSGDSTLLNLCGKWLLLDTGDASASNQLVKNLKSYGITKLDIYISHLHPDHYGGVEAVVENFDIETLYLPDASIGAEYIHQQRFMQKLISWSKAKKTVYLEKGDTFSYGVCKAEVLGPVGNYKVSDFKDDNAEGNTNDASHYLNNCSLTTKFTCGEISFLACGDIEYQEENALLKYYKNGELNADILKLSHHGLPTSNTEGFIKAVSPKYSFALSTGYQLYSVRKEASKYGLIYMVGDEKKNFGIKTNGKTITAYKDSSKLSGWVTLVGGNGTDSNTNKYYIKNNEILTGIQTIDSKKYHFSTGGCMEKGYYDEKGNYIPWNSMSDGVRAFYENGEMYTGFKTVSGNMFYFDKSTGIRKKGTKNWDIYKIDDNYYALNENGAVKTDGWKKYSVNSKTNYRYFDKKGVMKTGWQTISGKKYYLNKSTGFRTLGLKKISGKTYYFVEKNSAGYMYKSGWKKFGSNYRYFDKNGVMKTGWQTISGKKYYLNKSTGLRTLGLKKISGKTYYFVEKNSAGYMYKSGWKKFGSNYRYFDKKGVMKTGWQTIGGKKYYLNKSTGLRTLGLKKISGKYYYFVEKSSAGYVYKSGWKKFGKKYRYFASNGVMTVGWKTIKGNKYYFDKNGYRVTGTKKINGKTYKFNSSGKLKK